MRTRPPLPLFTLPILLLAPILVLLFSGASAAADPPAASPGDPTAEAARYPGLYAFAGGESESLALRRTVEALLADFNPLLRGIAKRRFAQTAKVPERIEIEPAGEGFTLTVVGAPDFPSRARYEQGALVLHQSSLEGSRTTRFRLSEDGTRLRMRVATRSRLLPGGDFDYELTFERRADGLAGPPPPLPSPAPVPAPVLEPGHDS